MSDSPLTVTNDLIVSMAYTLRLDNGQIVDSSEGRGPLEFLHGRGQIIPGLEKALTGMVVGDEKDVSVPPAEAYGEIDPNAFQVVPSSTFPSEMKLQVGQTLQMSNQSGRVFPATVVEIRPQGVLLNFNHPLAGETLNFQVKIAALRVATDEELAHGHVHGDGHHH
ncbi:MAG: peptidylprolyl isomerase [Anaerolineae bacterium]|nr:peptidylprolyl isomerase [Anaerolineae bacterium]